MPIPHDLPKRIAPLVLCALAVAACTSAGDPELVDAPPTTQAPTTTLAPTDLVVLITNDDGVESPGLDALAAELAEQPDTIVHIVVPAEDQSGVGDRQSEGAAATTPGETVAGIEATIIDGTPGDAVAYAVRKLDPAPNLVLAGPNGGQNIGIFAEQSATLGAGKVGARLGVPGLAVNVGAPAPFDYDQGVEIMLDWVAENRDALIDKSADPAVTLINVPNCENADGGEFRGLIEVPLAESFGERDPFETNCIDETDALTDDVDAFLAGYAPLTVISVDENLEAN